MMPGRASGFPHAVPLVCFLVAMVDGFDTLNLSFIAPLISKEWGLPPGSFGKIFASTYAGAALGATVIGIAADRFGRKAMLLISLAFAAAFTVAAGWSSSPSQLMLWRALAGVGLGGAIPTISALTAANAATGRRSSSVARVFLGYPLGAMVGGAITAAVMSSIGWRGVLIGGGLCASLLIPLVAFAVGEGMPAAGEPATNARNAVHSRHPLSELVSDHRGWGTMMLCTATFLTLLVSYFLVSWTPTVLTLNGTSPQRAAMAGTLLNLGGLLGAWTMSSMIERKNPWLTMACCFFFGSLLIAVLGQRVMVAGIIAYSLVFAVGLMIIGAQVNLPALCVRFYPTSVYATGVGLCMAVGRLGSIAGPLIGGYLVSAHVGWGRLFLVAAVPALLAGVAVALTPMMTKTR